MRSKTAGVGIIVAVVFFSAACASIQGQAGSDKHLRTVNVCVLNDKEGPASEKIIRALTANVFREYEEHIGVRFVAEAFVTAEINLDVWPLLELGDEANNACPQNTEVRMIFSNRRMLFIKKDGKEGELGGLSNEYYGFLVIFNVEGRVWAEDKGGNPALETTLKHEIGHIFGLGHTEDKNSFLYMAGNQSQGKWTDEILKKLLKNKDKKWH